MSEINLEELLEYISPAELDYSQWVGIGQALKTEGYPVEVWDSWSQADSRYHHGECEKKWNSFRGEGLTGATITKMAKDNGWKPGGSPWDWDSVIDYDGDEPQKPKEAAAFITEDIYPPSDDEWNPVRELSRYIKALFDGDDYIAFTTKSRKDDDGKLKPADRGTYAFTAEQILQRLEICGGDFESVIGSYNHEAGAWIRFNPLDGKGVGNANVTEYRYALVESDNMEIKQQAALIRELQLPVAMMVYSGGKSVHAIVKINAADEKEYRERVNYLYGICKKNGMTIDEQNKNASRLSRMPGCERGDKKQYIIDSNFGCRDFDSWKDYIEGINDDLPDFETVPAERPKLADELLKGVLRCGHKMLIAGPSKAAKSFLISEMAICICAGVPWLGKPVKQGKVLYVNLEIDGASFENRIFDIAEAMKVDMDEVRKNLVIWNLRGRAVPMNKLQASLIRRAKDKNFVCAVVDPIYKVLTGDENSASEMAEFCNQFDKICNQLGIAVIYCHHHSKGAQGHKAAQDRSSGSGVFARDPDAVLDLIEIEPKDANITLGENETAWRVSASLREFAPMKSIEIIFSHPVHRIAEGMSGCKEKYTGDRDTIRERNNEKQKSEKENAIDNLVATVAFCEEPQTTDELAEQMGVTEKSIRNYVRGSQGRLFVKNGMVFARKEPRENEENE